MDRILERILECMGTRHGAIKELAGYLQITASVITDWKSGRNKSYRRYLPNIAEFYNVNENWLKTGEGIIYHVQEESDYDSMNVVQNILNLAALNGVTDQQLCKILKTNSSKIYDWKRGKSKPSAVDILLLATFFDCSADYLLGLTLEKKYLVVQQDALVASLGDLSVEERQEVLNYVRFVKIKREL